VQDGRVRRSSGPVRGLRSERTARQHGDDGGPDGRDVDRPIRREWRRRRDRRRRPTAGRAALVAVVLLLVAAGTGAAALMVFADSPGLIVGCDLASARPRLVGSESFVYAADGSRLGAVPTTRNREPVALAHMSPWLPKATVAIEDRRFWQHGGIDLAGIARAALADLKAGRAVQGGSTLTQQLVRDRYLSRQHVTLQRKLQEACLAVALAQKWPRWRVLQSYLNLVFYGHSAYGVEAAARTYFSRPARDLTLGQAALLAGLPQAPSFYDPFRHHAAARARRNEVLTAMRKNGMISAARYRAAIARPLRLHPGDRYSSVRAAPFFDDAVRQLTSRYGKQRVRHGGLHIQTTLDARLERAAGGAIAGQLRKPSDPAAALVAIDPRSGAIRAMEVAAGGHRQLSFNLATQSRRQAGSAFKIFTLTSAIEQGIPLSSVWNGPPSITIPSRACLNATGSWVVHNYADESAGTMTLQQAIAHSVNTIFAQVVMKVGPRHVVEMAHRLGVRSPLKPVCSITLGPEGVSPLDMATAVSTLAAGGIRRDAQVLQRVTAADGKVLARLRPAGRRVLAPGVAHKVTYALSGVILAGTGTAANPGRPAAGKTGTAESYKDAWFCGYVPQLAACVWVGYPHAEIPLRNIEGFPQVFGGSIPARIWHDFMVEAMRGQPVEQLPTQSASGLQPASATQPGLSAPAVPSPTTPTTPMTSPTTPSPTTSPTTPARTTHP
jgi:penicillin-binding protein 1A